MKIYIAHPISWLSYREVVDYYETIRTELECFYDILSPMTGKGELRNEISFKAEGYGTPVSTNHAIVGRDRWMVKQADIVFVDFGDANRVSIGCVMELGWAKLLGKHTVVVLGKKNIHRHAFVLESADIVFPKLEDALDYLNKLSKNGY